MEAGSVNPCDTDFLLSMGCRPPFCFAMEFTGVEVSEIAFEERLSSRDFCEIFRVVIRGKTCAMKVVSVE